LCIISAANCEISFPFHSFMFLANMLFLCSMINFVACEWHVTSSETYFKICYLLKIAVLFKKILLTFNFNCDVSNTVLCRAVVLIIFGIVASSVNQATLCWPKLKARYILNLQLIYIGQRDSCPWSKTAGAWGWSVTSI
jgi:hypothetical protein